MQATSDKVETGKQWVTHTMESMAKSFNIGLTELQWQSARDGNGIVHTCSVQGRTKKAAKLFSEEELVSCPLDTHLQQVLVARLANLMRYLAS